MTQEAYAEQAHQWAKALKLVDPTIQLVLCGKEGATDWDHHVLRRCLLPAGLSDLGEYRPPLVDMHSIHLYTASENHYENVTAPLAAERAIEVASGLIDLARIENKVPANQTRPTICFDEWNVWLPTRAPGSKGGEETYTLSDALAVAVWLNVFIRKSRDVSMACIAQSVNVISPLMTTRSGIIKQTTWWPYELFCKYMQGHTISCHVSCGKYERSTLPDFIRGTKDTPWLDVSATLDDNGWVSLCVVNIHETEDLATSIEGCHGVVQVFMVTGANARVNNMGAKEEVSVKESTWEAEGSYTFPKHSMTLLRWQT